MDHFGNEIKIEGFKWNLKLRQKKSIFWLIAEKIAKGLGHEQNSLMIL